MYYVEDGAVYLGDWAESKTVYRKSKERLLVGLNEMCDDFDILPEDITMDILFAAYRYESYDGKAFVLLQDDKEK